MITLITGVPGSGKSLYGISLIKAKAEAENRVVYYSGIDGLALPWLELEDSTQWHKCPPNSIIVIDECQRVFRPRAMVKEVPEHVSKFETHRHDGLDVYLITQHPMLIDNNIRRLAGQHFHVVRKMGLQFARVYEWSSCHEITKANLKSGVTHEFKYPKDAFSWYKSAEVHTVKRNIPKRVWFLLASPFLVAALGYLAYRSMWSVSHPKSADSLQGQSSAQVQPMTEQGASGTRNMSKKDYVQQYVPRLEGLAYTAPIYDEVTKPVRAPVPAGAVSNKKTCRAYTDQGTVLDVPDDICRQIAVRGFYRDFDNRPEPVPQVPTKNGVAAQETASSPVHTLGQGSSLAPVQAVTSASFDQNTSTNPRWNPAVRN